MKDVFPQAVLLARVEAALAAATAAPAAEGARGGTAAEDVSLTRSSGSSGSGSGSYIGSSSSSSAVGVLTPPASSPPSTKGMISRSTKNQRARVEKEVRVKKETPEEIYRRHSKSTIADRI